MTRSDASRDRETIAFRHLTIGVVSALLVYLFYLSYGSWGVELAVIPDWSEDHPLWRAYAHAAFILLVAAMTIGPLAKLWEPGKRALPWRRVLGIWFAILSLGHAYVIWDRWGDRDFLQLFGYQYIPEMNDHVMVQPEVGIMNLMGLMILPAIILLAITSTSKAEGLLGHNSWKWLHTTLLNAIFYVIVIRGVLYMFYLFEPRAPEFTQYPDVWFLYPFIGLATLVVVLQAAAFAKTVLENRAEQADTSVSEYMSTNQKQVLAVAGIAAFLILPMVFVGGAVAYMDIQTSETPEIPGDDQQPDEQQPPAGDTDDDPPTDVESANSFYMVIHESDEDVHFWARNLDSEPEFRQTIEIDGETMFDLLYLYEERTLYTGERTGDGDIEWSTDTDVEPDEVGIDGVITGPAAWAAEYGPGEHQIETPDGDVDVTVHSVDEDIEDDVFTPPENTE